MKKLILSFIILVLMIPLGYAKENVGSRTLKFDKPALNSYELIDVNTISAWVRNNGSIFRHPTTGNSGFEWPKDGGVFAIYASGIWMGARVNGTPRVAIAEYSYEYGPGQILNGVPEDPDDPNLIVYKLNKGDDVPQDIIDRGGPTEVLGDQMLWAVFNDGDPLYHVNMGTEPLGAEVQATVFAFDRLGPLGNTVFIKWLVVNKSGTELEDAYISVWSDPDLGDSGDDFVGCDTVLSLGYVYNSANVDGEYGASPPAAGYDYLQGPIVPSPGDTALVSGVKFPDYRNLPMTSFVYYNNSNENNGNPQTGPEAYNYMQARWRDGTRITEGGTGIDPNNPPTNYMFTGDPEAGTGWNDSSPADRRFMMSTGPFTMEAFNDLNGDGKPQVGEPGVQEIVVGVAVARGLNNLNSATLLKFFDTFVQRTYDANFQIPEPPPTPEVTATALSNEIVLDWDTPYNRNTVETYYEYNIELQKDETIPEEEKYFEFEGYLVYQYDFLDRTNAEVVATYDIVNGLGTIIDLEFDPSTGQFIPILRIQGNDEGLKRWISIKENKFSQTAENILYNGTRYWFGLASYGYNVHSVPAVIEGSSNLIEITPQSPAIGTSYAGSSDQLLKSVKTGESDGGAFGLIVDPSLVTGNDYTVNFTLDTTNAIYWGVTNTTTSTTLLDSQYFQGTDSAYTDYPVSEGIQWKVLGPPPGINLSIPGPYGPGQGEDGWNWDDGTSTRWISGYNAGGPTFFHGMFNGADFFGSDLGPADYVSVELRWAGVTDRSDESALALAAASQAEYPDRWSRAVVYRRDLGYAVQQTLGWVPFSLWDTWAEPERRLKIAFVEMDGENGAAANNLWDMGWSGTDTLFPGENGCREYLFLLNDTYDEDYTEYLNENLDGTYNNSMYAIWPTSRSRDYLLGTWNMQIFASRVNTPSTVYSFSTDSVKATVGDMSMAKSDIDKINVYPNPYYGTHANERLPTERWVEFTHLPPNCTIRIFTIAGALVRTIERTGVTESTTERWDLQNEAELPVASGIYIYHIDIPDIGEEKIGKLAVFMPQERLDTF
jgi:hypothetical protein